MVQPIRNLENWHEKDCRQNESFCSCLSSVQEEAGWWQVGGGLKAWYLGLQIVSDPLDFFTRRRKNKRIAAEIQRKVEKNVSRLRKNKIMWGKTSLFLGARTSQLDQLALRWRQTQLSLWLPSGGIDKTITMGLRDPSDIFRGYTFNIIYQNNANQKIILFD